MNQNAQMEQRFRVALAANPNSLEAILGLAGITAWSGDVTEAVGLCERAIRINPNIGVPYYQLGLCRLREKRFQDAAANFETALKFSPHVATIHHHLGVALLNSGRSQEAIAAFRKAIELDPNAALSNAELGHLLLGIADFEGAVACFRRVAELQPDSARGQFFLGRALIEEQKFGEGEQHLRRAISMDPGTAETYVLLARMLQQQGRFDEARIELDRVIALDPGQADGYYLLLTGRTITESDRQLIDRVETILDSGRLSPAETRPPHYALGKAYDDLREYEAAFDHFEAANGISRERLNAMGRIFDPKALSFTIDRTISQFTKRYLENCKDLGVESDKPIFIVGMARSGTTLLEQIVSSHPEVAAAGELGTWTAMSSGPFQNSHPTPNKTEIGILATEFLRKLDRIAPNSRFVTVKTPQNYMILGQILATFPNAKVLHCTRSPIDTCLSIYMTSFQSGPDFAHDRKSLVIAYKEYLRIMAHWRKTLPPDRLIDVRYESLVADREPILRRVLDFLNLSWSDECLHHERNDHAISTPSLWQARQPVFSRSVQRWRRYEPWLGPLRELLEVENG